MKTDLAILATVVAEKKLGIKDDTKYFGLNQSKNRIFLFDKMGDTARKARDTGQNISS